MPAARKRVRKEVPESFREDDEPAEPGYSYFADAAAKEGIKFVSTGCAALDAALGGGWAMGRVVNIVGDKSTGKTLLTMESMANFAYTDPKGWMRYGEAEHAFDEPYARALGMPMERIEFNQGDVPLSTVEEFYHDLERCIEQRKKNQHGIYVLDSLDALSDDAEQGRDFGEASYGGTKPKALSEFFRRKIADIKDSGTLLVVVSQIRDKLGVTFGPTKTRSGGKALDFYASQVVWLSEIGKITKTRDKIERVVGIKVRAKITKNKVGLPFREVDYPVMFGYGIDDLTANVEWLLSVGAEKLLTKEFEISKAGYATRLANLRNKGGAEVQELRQGLTKMVFQQWAEVETKFLPTARKYGG